MCKFLITYIYVLDNQNANNYYSFSSIQLLLFLLYRRLRSAPIEHENLCLKIELKVKQFYPALVK